MSMDSPYQSSRSSWLQVSIRAGLWIEVRELFEAAVKHADKTFNLEEPFIFLHKRPIVVLDGSISMPIQDPGDRLLAEASPSDTGPEDSCTLVGASRKVAIDIKVSNVGVAKVQEHLRLSSEPASDPQMRPQSLAD